jgi:hypothetical protein
VSTFKVYIESFVDFDKRPHRRVQDVDFIASKDRTILSLFHEQRLFRCILTYWDSSIVVPMTMKVSEITDEYGTSISLDIFDCTYSYYAVIYSF